MQGARDSQGPPPALLDDAAAKPMSTVSLALLVTQSQAWLCIGKVWNRERNREGERAGNEIFFLGSSAETSRDGEGGSMDSHMSLNNGFEADEACAVECR